MEYKYAGTYSDMKRIDKLNKMTNPKTFWSEIDKITKNLVSLTAINSWNMLAEIRYKLLILRRIVMKIPYVEAKDSETGQIVKGFYFEYPETTYCFTEDYEREPKVKLIPCVMSHRMTDWGLPNVPTICTPIDKSTLEIIGYIETDNNYYIPSSYVK